MPIEIKILNDSFYTRMNLPRYETKGAAGIDLKCTDDIIIYPGERKLISTGLAIWIASINKHFKYSSECDMMGIIVPRSGLGSRGLILANTIGIIDSDYQGELKISAWNACIPVGLGGISDDSISIHHNIIRLEAGDRIAQLLFVPIIKASWEVVDEFSSDTGRDRQGFGSTSR